MLLGCAYAMRKSVLRCSSHSRLFLSCQVSRLAAEPVFVCMQVQGVSQKVAAAFGIDKLEGVLVRNAALNGPANMAGIHRGDMIVK
jgi:hypothetical protein